jgi:PAS domain S-box-containing protein
MKQFKNIYACIFILLIQLVYTSYCLADTKDVRIGVLAFRPLDISKLQWQPTADYLNSQLPDYHFTITPLNYTDLDLAINRREFDFVLTNPEHYITIREDHGLNSIATLMPSIDGRPVTTFGGVIFTRSDRTDIKDIEDVKDKIISTPTNQSLGGYSMQIWTLLKNGIEKKQIKQFRFTGMPHDNVVEEVIDGKADVGFVRTGVIEAMTRDGKIRLNQINVLNRQAAEVFPLMLSTDLYPEWPLAAELDVPQTLKKMVAIALFNIQPNDRAAQSGKYYGFTSAGDYSTVESLMKRINENPERTHEFEVRDIVRKYSIQLQFASLIVILVALATAVYLIMVNKKINKMSLEREGLAEKLADVNSELEAANQNLESTVEERTAQLRESEQQAQHAMLELQLQKLALDEHAIVSITDVTGAITYVNDKFCQISKHLRNELIGQDHLLVNSSYHAKGYFRSMYRDISEGMVWHNEVCNKAKDGSLYWVEMTIVPFKDKEGNIYQYISISTDITPRKKSEIEIQNLAFNDPLTGLSNRRMFMDRLTHSFASNLTSVRLKIKQNHLVIGRLLNGSGGVRLQGA